MIIIQTKQAIPHAEALLFEQEQGEKNVKKENILSVEPSVWELRVSRRYSINSREFYASVTWIQRQPQANGTERRVVMFQEDFVLPMQEAVQQIWEAVDGQILTQDNLGQKIEEFVIAGVLHYIGVERNCFNIGVENFEVIYL